METVILLIVIGAVAGALGLVLGRYLWPAATSAAQIALTTAQAEAKHLADEVVRFEEREGAQESALQRKSDALQEEEKKSARLEERVAALTKQVEGQVQTIAAATAAQAEAEAQAKTTGENAARLAERESGYVKQVATLTEQVHELTSARDKALADSKASDEEVVRLMSTADFPRKRHSRKLAISSSRLP